MLQQHQCDIEDSWYPQSKRYNWKRYNWKCCNKLHLQQQTLNTGYQLLMQTHPLHFQTQQDLAVYVDIISSLVFEYQNRRHILKKPVFVWRLSGRRWRPKMPYSSRSTTILPTQQSTAHPQQQKPQSEKSRSLPTSSKSISLPWLANFKTPRTTANKKITQM